MKVDFYKHNLNNEDRKNFARVMRSTFISLGETVNTFEEKFAKYFDVQYAVGLNSCTAGLHLALLACDIGPGDEVITTPLSFIATANAIEYTGAKPVFVDVEEETGNLNAELIEKYITKKTKAIIPVHLYGQMCDMKSISKIAKRNKVAVVEDAAHAVESERDGIKPGQLSDAACFSFYATKNLTCGDGGALTTNSEKINERVRVLRLHGMSASAQDRYTKKYKHYDMNVLGYKYNMTDLEAALLLNQLDRVDKQWDQRKKIVTRYNKALEKNPKVTLFQQRENVRNAYHLFTLLTQNGKRDEILHALQENDIGVAVNFRPIHLMNYYKNKYGFKVGDFPIAENLGARTLTLPLYPKLSKKQQEHVIQKLLKAL